MSKPTTILSSGWLDLSSLSNVDAVLYDGAEVVALHHKTIQPVSQFTKIPVALKSSGQVSSVNYQFPKTADFAGDTWFDFTTPDIKVKTANLLTYRIAFTPNLGHNVFNNLVFQANEIPIVRNIDPVAMDFLSEANLSPSKYELYMKMIGNVSTAVTFSSHLPPTHVKKHLHELWFGNKGKAQPEQALQLCCLKNNTLSLQAEFVESLADVIRIQHNTAADPAHDPAVWEDVDPKSVNLATLVDVAGSAGLTMPLPSVWSEVVLIQADERKQHQSQKIDVIIEQIQQFTSQKVKAGTLRSTFHFSYPVRYLLFGAQNKSSSDLHNFSNYTTSTDPATGLDPVRTVTLWYDNNPRLQNFGGDYFAEDEFYAHAARGGAARGVHLLTYCYNTASTEIDGSSNYSKLASDLQIEINEVSTNSDDPAITGSDYTLEIRGVSFQCIRLEDGTVAFPSFQN
jgi:hypothetical protein